MVAPGSTKDAGTNPEEKRIAISNIPIGRRIDIEEVVPARLVESIVKASAVSSVPDAELENVIQQVIGENPKAVADYKKGKEHAIMFLVGQIMRVTKGSIDPKKAKIMISSLLT